MREGSKIGKGLSALLNQKAFSERNNDENIRVIPIEHIFPNKNQPRKTINTETINELAESIRLYGILQPILVQKKSPKEYMILAGERRWRAARIASLKEIPVIIKHFSDHDKLKIALIENIQRENLNPLEEAESYFRLIEEYKYTQDQLGQILNKSRTYIANILRINSLPQSVKDKIAKGLITTGHAKVLVNHDKAEDISNKIIEESLSVRDTEALVKNNDKNDDLRELEKFLKEKFGTKVSIRYNNNRQGKLTFHFSSLEELDLILNNL